MEPGAHTHHTAGPGHGDRAGLLRHVLSELQAEARDVFASSGESVDRFLRERRDEAMRECGIPV
jgi:hypothetical protein